MNLTSIINTIRSAIYGKDMREALAQGFEAIDEEMEGGMGGGFVLAAQALLTDVGNCEYEEIEVNAVDLVDSGVNTDRLDFMKFSRVISEPHGVNLLLLCTKMVEPLDDPAGKKFTFGSKKKRLSSYQSKYNATTERSYNIGRNVKTYVTDS